MKRFYILIYLFVFGLSPIACFAQQEPDVPTKTLNISGLQGKVIIRRDDRGIPHIEATSENDLYFAQGYVMAQDRLWQMDLLRRVARGELSEIFGRTTLEEDKRWRKYGFAKVSAETLPLLAPETLAALENYARGVNAYIASLDQNSLPTEFKILQFRPREWKPEDSIIAGKILAEGLSTTWRFDLVKVSLQSLPAEKFARLYEAASPHDVLLIGNDTAQQRKKNKGQEKKVGIRFTDETSDELAKDEQLRQKSLERIGLYVEDLAASNNWVIAGKRTVDGKPILANDPHLPANAPSVWYLINLSAPNFHAAGVTIPGAPSIILGHNEKIAWGATNVGPDVQDLYLEEFDANNPRRYKTPAGWQEAEIRREEIKVRKNPFSPDTETEVFEVTTTRNGPIFFEDAGKRFALKWTAFDRKNNELEAFYFLNRAANWNDFRAALKRYGGSMQNFVYADTSGNIGWYAAGRVPLRKTGDGSTPHNGATDNGEWIGLVPFEELPNLYNPSQNFIVTANQRIAGKSYKYQEVIRDFAAPFRARRIYELIEKNLKITVEETNRIQRDIYNLPLVHLTREIVSSKAAADETIKLFQNWNGQMSADSKAALLASEIFSAFSKRIFDANLSPAQRKQFGINALSSFLDKLVRDKPKDWLPKEFTNYEELFRACEKDARTTLAQKLGTDEAKWVWGEANKIRFNHPLAAIPFVGGQFLIDPLPLNGSSNSPNVGAGVSMRLIATPGNWDATRHEIALGESGNPTSPHWRDQLDNWYKGSTPAFPFSQKAVVNAMKEKLILESTK